MIQNPCQPPRTIRSQSHHLIARRDIFSACWIFWKPILYGDAAVNSSYFQADDPYFQANDYIMKAYILGGPALVSDDFAIALLAKG